MGRRRPAVPPPPGPPPSLHGAIPIATLDLHGETRDAAVQKLRWFVERWERQRPGAVLEIVTGRGNRSAGAPVLKAAVEDVLREELADRITRWVVQPGGGAVLLELKG